MKKINLQLFADFSEILTEHADAFAGDEKVADTFNGLSTKLKDLGYDVLINKREAAEYVPAHRLNSTVAERENYKAQLEQTRGELAKMQANAGVPDDVKTQLGQLIETNNELLKQLEQSNIQFEIVALANDAIDPVDIVKFVDMEKIKLDKSGKVASGAKEEVERIRTERPYLFGKTKTPLAKGGTDNGAGDGDAGGKVDMNKAIRRAAFGGGKLQI